MAEARQVKNRIVQAVLRECQKLKEKDDLTDELEHVRDIKNKKERLIQTYNQYCTLSGADFSCD